MPPINYTTRTFVLARFQVANPVTPRNANIDAQRQKRVATVTVPERDARSWRVTLSPPRVLAKTATGADIENPIINWSAVPMRATVRWGDLSAIHTAELDWGKGCSFSVHAHHVEVDAFVPLDAAILGAAARDTFVEATANIAPDEGGEEIKPPTWTTEPAGMSPGNQRQILIPRFARRVRWWQRGSSLPLAPALQASTPFLVAVEQYQDDASSIFCGGMVATTTPNNEIAVGAITYGHPGEAGWALHPSASYLLLTNMDAAEEYDLAVQFDLDLG